MNNRDEGRPAEGFADETGSHTGRDCNSEVSDIARLEELLIVYEEACQRGSPPDLEVLCGPHRHLLEAIRERVEGLKVSGFFLEETLHGYDSASTSDVHGGPANISQTTHYENLSRPRAGAMGIVYTAHDAQFGREIAVKVMQPTLLNNPLAERQFRDEACITALLDHPGVVPILGIGQLPETRQPFYSMRLLHGASFKQAIEDLYRGGAEGVFRDERSFVVFRRLLSAFVSICKTIDYAHQRAVIHCDLKPANIHIGKHGEAIVLDWGLARKYNRQQHQVDSPEVSVLLPNADNQSSSSVSGGTPIFMSPEQANGSTHLGPAADIYGLGAILFVLITGDYPVSRDLPGFAVLEQVRNHQLRSARDLNPQVPRDLEAICIKAMSFRPSDRYATAMALAEDVERYLNDLPVAARTYTWQEQSRRTLRRHAGMVLLGTVSLLILLVMAGAGLLALSRSSSAEYQAKIRTQQALEESTQMAAEMTSRFLSRVTRERIRAVEAIARREDVMGVLSSINTEETPEVRQQVQSLLQQLRQADRIFGEHDSWNLYDASGTQVARIPESSTIGKNYAYRDYFTGLGYDLPAGGNAEGQHIEQPYQSTVFRSQADRAYKTTISAPVYGDGLPGQKPFLGIIGIAVSLENFIEEFKSTVDTSQAFLIVDFRLTKIAGQDVEGLILYHSSGTHAESAQEISPADYLRPEDLAVLKELLSKSGPQASRGSAVYQLESFQDPMTGKTARGAFSPIVVANHGRELEWGIVVYSAE